MQCRLSFSYVDLHGRRGDPLCCRTIAGVSQWLSYWSALQEDEIREWVAKISNYLSIEVILNSGWLQAGLKWAHPWQETKVWKLCRVAWESGGCCADKVMASLSGETTEGLRYRRQGCN